MRNFLFLVALCALAPSLKASQDHHTPQWWVETGMSYGINQRYIHSHDIDFGSSSPVGGDFTLGYKVDTDVSLFVQFGLTSDSSTDVTTVLLTPHIYSYELDSLQLSTGIRMHNKITDNLSLHLNMGIGLISHEAVLTTLEGPIENSEMIDANHFEIKLGLMLQYNFTDNFYAYFEGSFNTEFISDTPQEYEGNKLQQYGQYRIGIGFQF